MNSILTAVKKGCQYYFVNYVISYYYQNFIAFDSFFFNITYYQIVECMVLEYIFFNILSQARVYS